MNLTSYFDVVSHYRQKKERLPFPVSRNNIKVPPKSHVMYTGKATALCYVFAYDIIVSKRKGIKKAQRMSEPLTGTLSARSNPDVVSHCKHTECFLISNANGLILQLKYKLIMKIDFNKFLGL